MFLLQSFYSNKTAVSDLSNFGSFQFSVDIRYTGSHMVYILPLSCYKNNEQLFNKSCQEQQKISRIGSCFRGSRGILHILFPYFCIFLHCSRYHNMPFRLLFYRNGYEHSRCFPFSNRKVFGSVHWWTLFWPSHGP